MSGWVVAAYAAGIRPHPGLLGAWCLLFLGWIAIGFHPNLYDHPNQFSIAQEVINVATKDGLAAIFVIGGLAPFRLRAGTSAAQAPPLATRARGESVRT
jgi:hypothetical protein